ncbi:MAG TPA: DUF1579 domain-containing protein [Chitinophagaceae bacterium]|nr:DUF1579 domain-containing protein [Chitinophagaceae bacterium]
MKRILLTICAAAGLLLACNNKEDKTDGTTTPEVKEEAWVPVDSATMMKNMMEYGTPGPMHSLLASWDGTWTGEMTMWDYEGATPYTAATTAVNTMLMDGKYQSSTHSGNMMGMPFEGRSIMGYDNATKKFTSAWIDNFSTGIMIMSGTWDDASKTMTLTGTTPDINRPGKECNMREIFRVVDENTQYMEMYGPDHRNGKEYKMFEIKMTRKKK